MRSAYGLDEVINNMRNQNTRHTRQPLDYIYRREASRKVMSYFEWLAALVTFIVILAATGLLFGNALAARKSEPVAECIAKPQPQKTLQPKPEKSHGNQSNKH